MGIDGIDELKPGGENEISYTFTTEEDAQNVLAAMQGVINTYSCVTLGDLRDLVGITKTVGDDRIGWLTIVDVKVKKTAKGFTIFLPKPTHTH